MWPATKSSRPKRNALDDRPIRAPRAQLERLGEGGARLKLPVRASWLVRAGATRTFELDEIGLLVWDACDGKTSVEQIIRGVADRYRLNLREAEVATLKFMDMLGRR